MPQIGVPEHPDSNPTPSDLRSREHPAQFPTHGGQRAKKGSNQGSCIEEHGTRRVPQTSTVRLVRTRGSSMR
jgi:hypothetical protein